MAFALRVNFLPSFLFIWFCLIVTSQFYCRTFIVEIDNDRINTYVSV